MIPFFNFKSITPMAPKYMTTILDWFFKNTIEDYEWFNPHDDMRIHKSNINLYIEMKNIWVKEIIALQYFDNIEDDIKKLCKTVNAACREIGVPVSKSEDYDEEFLNKVFKRLLRIRITEEKILHAIKRYKKNHPRSK